MRGGSRKPIKDDEEEDEIKNKAVDSAVKNEEAVEETEKVKVHQENIIRAP